jgi:hypothetical protein
VPISGAAVPNSAAVEHIIFGFKLPGLQLSLDTLLNIWR